MLNEIMPLRGIGFIKLVMEHGKKHDTNGQVRWRSRIQTAEGREKYLAGIKRHLAAIDSGEVFDKDSGLPHIAHIAARAAILSDFDYEFDNKGEPGKTNSGLVFCCK